MLETCLISGPNWEETELHPRSQSNLAALFDPRSIAVIGASDNVSKFGGRPIHFMLQAGFAGPIYPVNLKGGEIQGLTAYKDIRDVPEPVDMAVVTVPARFVVEAVEAAAEASTKSVVIFSSGFAESGDEGEAWQRRLAEIAAENDMRIVGPNCLGMLNVSSRAIGTFSALFSRGWPKPGNISVICQSGAVGAYLLSMAQERGLGLRSWITTGNEVDVDVSDCILHCAEDPGTEVIVAYIEGTKKADRLLRAFEAARRARKPVVLMKVGASEIGAIAASTHTASLVGADAVYDAVFRQHGVYRADSLEDMLDIAQASSLMVFPETENLGVLTVSGGVGVIASDAAEKAGLNLPVLPQDLQDHLKRLMPFAAVRNPIDTTGQMITEPELFRESVRVMLRTGLYSSLLIFLSTIGIASPALLRTLLEILRDIAETKKNELLVISMQCDEETQREIEELGFLVCEDPSRAVHIVSVLGGFAKAFRKARGIRNIDTTDAVAPPGAPLGEREAADLLQAHDIPMAPGGVAGSADAGVRLAEQYGYPVVLKVASPDIAHKSDIGGVRLNLNSADDVRAAFDEILLSARDKMPAAAIEGCLVAPMLGGGVETILGVHRDPVFGPVVLFGLGGVFVEVLQDVTMRVAPFDTEEAHRMIDEIRGRAMLDGVRGAAKSDIDALASALSALSVFAVAHANWLESVDINPFLVLEQGGVGLDAVVVPRKTG
ncbi:acetate--CoA ligase family protein [Pacificispira sp.]|uniref:acetate--CoA ligase family protein n=1 Tax=Pacificispira sp. TaxID=2888761 RepID=UPI003B52FB42